MKLGQDPPRKMTLPISFGKSTYPGKVNSVSVPTEIRFVTHDAVRLLP